jgi:hypothetical protein
MTSSQKLTSFLKKSRQLIKLLNWDLNKVKFYYIINNYVITKSDVIIENDVIINYDVITFWIYQKKKSIKLLKLVVARILRHHYQLWRHVYWWSHLSLSHRFLLKGSRNLMKHSRNFYNFFKCLKGDVITEIDVIIGNDVSIN